MLRAREAKLLSRDALERMLGESFADACRAAAEAGYADMTGMDTAGISAALERRRSEELAELRDMIPDEALPRFFALPYDCHNAKVLVKSGGDRDAAERLFSGAGTYSLDELWEVYSSDDGDGALPPLLAEAIRSARGVLARTGNPQLADFQLDRACFALLRALAGETGRPYFTDYVRNRIDKVNLRSLLRTLDMGRRAEMLDAALIEGGSVSLDRITDPGLSREDIVRLYGATIFDAAAEENGMTAFEKAADNAELREMSGGSLIPFGPEVALEYVTALENEIMSLRIILTGKKMGIGAETLRERLRENYV